MLLKLKDLEKFNEPCPLSLRFPETSNEAEEIIQFILH